MMVASTGERMLVGAMLVLLAVPSAACSTPSQAFCSTAGGQDFYLDVAGCAAFPDIPSGAATCSISASTTIT